jgi:hypothetical protein
VGQKRVIKDTDFDDVQPILYDSCIRSPKIEALEYPGEVDRVAKRESVDLSEQCCSIQMAGIYKSIYIRLLAIGLIRGHDLAQTFAKLSKIIPGTFAITCIIVQSVMRSRHLERVARGGI